MGLGGIPLTMPAEFVDRSVYLGARAGVYRLELGGIVSFAGRLDETRLRKAMRLVLDAEPVLGCRFDAEAVPPVWRRLDALDPAWLLISRDTSDPAADGAAFIAEPFEQERDPQVRALLLHTPKADVLAVRFDHLATDGGAVKEGLYEIARIYRRLGEQPDFVPEPNVDGVRAPVVDAGLLEKLGALGPGDLKTPPGDPDWYVPLSGQRGPASYVADSVEPTVFRRALEDARAIGATANDVILAALYRTLWRLLDAKPAAGTPMMMTCELRKHLRTGVKTAIANISSVCWVSVPNAPSAESFDATLARVAEATRAWKRRGAGKSSAIGIPIMHRLFAKKALAGLGKMMFPKEMDLTRGAVVLTNIGIVDAGLLDFGDDAPVVDACILGPVSPLGAGLAASTYRDRLHLIAGVEFAAIGEEMARAIVSGTAREIEAWAGPAKAVDLERSTVTAGTKA